MLEYLLEFLRNQPVLVFFLVLSLGYLVGNIRVAGISLSSVSGVLLVGLLFGHLGFTMHAGAQSFGFAIFIFCVGYQAGARIHRRSRIRQRDPDPGRHADHADLRLVSRPASAPCRPWLPYFADRPAECDAMRIDMPCPCI